LREDWGAAGPASRGAVLQPCERLEPAQTFADVREAGWDLSLPERCTYPGRRSAPANAVPASAIEMTKFQPAKERPRKRQGASSQRTGV
jgi:hypothetical protein